VLAATSRLRRSAEFAAVMRGGDRAGRGAVVVHLSTAPPTDRQPAPARDRSPARAGFVVSRAVGPAVVRNKVRRRLRHLVRDRLNALPPGARLVVRALPAAATTPYAQLGADLDAALEAARSRRRRTGGAR
jgi:ribonuclease P protein component